MIRAMRPKQWTKNALLLPALVFSERYTDASAVLSVALGIVLFCMLSSAGYLVNDLRDVENDRKHPKKKLRPIASGEMGEGAARALAALLIALGLGGSVYLSVLHAAAAGSVDSSLWNNWGFAITAASYLFVTLSYSMYFKHVVLLDVMFISTGFLLRAVAGAAVIPVESSAWFLICTAFGALFLGLSKRLAELRLLNEAAVEHRKILDEYTPALLEQLISIVTACTLISYALYTFTGPHGQQIMLTVPFVIYGMFRYLFLVSRGEAGGEPETTLLRDRPLQACILLFMLVAVVTLSPA
jgi:4-hydroxybenzoate polyprenyltransferase